MSGRVSTGYVVSQDGTTIGYLRQGVGPGIVLVQGAMADVYAYRALARALSSSFTVITVERRGRGISPSVYTADHSIDRDVEDLDAIMNATGVRSLFGLSSGAVIALEATRTLDRVERVAVYEPPFYSGGIDRDGISRLNAEIECGRFGAALVDALIIAGTAPAFITRAPRLLACAVAGLVLIVQSRLPGLGSSLRELLPSVRFDFRVVGERDGRIREYASITQPVLLLSGTTSPAFLQNTVQELADIIPRSRHVEFSGLGHDGPWNNGGAAKIAVALGNFFTA